MTRFSSLSLDIVFWMNKRVAVKLKHNKHNKKNTDVYKFEYRHRLSQIYIIYKDKCLRLAILAETATSLWSFDSVSTWWYFPKGRPYSQTICGCSKCNHPRLRISIAVFPSPVPLWDESSALIFITIPWHVQATCPGHTKACCHLPSSSSTFTYSNTKK